MTFVLVATPRHRVQIVQQVVKRVCRVDQVHTCVSGVHRVPGWREGVGWMGRMCAVCKRCVYRVCGVFRATTVCTGYVYDVYSVKVCAASQEVEKV